jgi:hypothetical protein
MQSFTKEIVLTKSDLHSLNVINQSFNGPFSMQSLVNLTPVSKLAEKCHKMILPENKSKKFEKQEKI